MDVVNARDVTIAEIWSEGQRNICLDWIQQGTYKTICLQFPDTLLAHSVEISEDIKASLSKDAKVFILADTSYGSCCIDEIAAAHVAADSLIHFGSACRSKVSPFPVLYMFPQHSISLHSMLEQLKTLVSFCRNKPVCIYLDIGYHELKNEIASASICDQLAELLNASAVHIEVFPPPEGEKSHYSAAEDPVCVFVGADNSRFAIVSLTTKASKWFIYDPSSDIMSEKNPLTSKYMRKRYFYIEKCKDAQVLGLIAATLTTCGYLEVIARIQEMAKKCGIRTQIISVGRINPAKLANFLDIDCFVLIGCPFNTLYNAKTFYKPVVSVFEAEMALNPAWTSKYPETYVSDFKELLPEGRHFLEFNPDDVLEQDISLINGRIRSTTDERQTPTVDSAIELSVTERNKLEMMTATTRLAFDDRTWKGLDPSLGCTEPAKLQKGLSGIPIAYSYD